jgi:hypothetical protein
MGAAADSGMIYLQEGHVVGMTLPLSPDIEARWRAGHLTRVHADGSAWQDSDGDPFAVLSGEPASADDNGTPDTTTTSGSDEEGQDDPDQPKRPRGNAPRPEWAAYAVALGVATEDEAAKLTRDELKKLVTPPEMLPPDP